MGKRFHFLPLTSANWGQYLKRELRRTKEERIGSGMSKASWMVEIAEIISVKRAH